MKNILKAIVILIVAQSFCMGLEIDNPDPKLTPGKINPLLTKDVICAPGFRTDDYRNVSLATKKEVFRRYKIPWKDRSHYEVDHLIALTDGGSNDIENLWPELYNPRPGAHEKDVLEYWLHLQICTESMDLTQAQKILAKDWVSSYLVMKKTRRKK